MLWGVGLFWLANAVLTIGDMARRQKIPFNMGWWGFTFPLGVYAANTMELGVVLDLMFFKVFGTVGDDFTIVLKCHIRKLLIIYCLRF